MAGSNTDPAHSLSLPFIAKPARTFFPRPCLPDRLRPADCVPFCLAHRAVKRGMLHVDLSDPHRPMRSYKMMGSTIKLPAAAATLGLVDEGIISLGTLVEVPHEDMLPNPVIAGVAEHFVHPGLALSVANTALTPNTVAEEPYWRSGCDQCMAPEQEHRRSARRPRLCGPDPLLLRNGRWSGHAAV